MERAEKLVLIHDLQDRLKALICAAVQVKNIGDQISGWEPIMGRCHQNVDRWVSKHPDDRATRGWIRTAYMALPGFIRLMSHSVVETPAGTLLDVTLPVRECHHQFIRHPGSDAEFLELVADNGCPWIDIPLDEPDLGLAELADLVRQMENYTTWGIHEEFDF